MVLWRVHSDEAKKEATIVSIMHILCTFCGVARFWGYPLFGSYTHNP